MGRGKALRVLVMLVSMAVLREGSCGCEPSGCGKITNISHPFRLRDDPPECGDRRYELACESDVTVLYLYSGRYPVLGINYHNYTIRIVDPRIQEGDCSSIPRYFLYPYNFSYTIDMSYFTNANGDPYSVTPSPSIRSFQPALQYVIYLNCSDAVERDDGHDYVDTSPCVNWESKGHIYAIPGGLPAANLTDHCHLKLVAPITPNWESLLQNSQKNYSYAHLHRVLSYGFDLYWWPSPCAHLSCPSDSYCDFNDSSGKFDCSKLDPLCHTPLGDTTICGKNISKLRIFAEDYLYGTYKGLSRIFGHRIFERPVDYDFDLTQLGVGMGEVTGRFVLPYIAVRFLGGITFLLVLLIYTCRRRHLSIYENIEDFLQLNSLVPIRYSYKELKSMTRGFKDKLGEGGFGTVYKGKLRSGPNVAIKMLGKSKANGQEFVNEVATIGRIHHVHVVRLVGYCVEGSKRALVYEYMPNGSLDKYIFSKEESVSLSYDKIYEISLGVARGIVYLHHGCDMQILHFDIKPHNILLDENFIPKISDFGLAKLYHVDDSIVTLTAARGTIGYMAPELFYKNIGGVSYKADVYSFGMLLMEMANRRRNLNPHAEHSSQIYFPLWIYDQFTEEKDIEIEDLTLEEKNIVKKMFIIALWCIQLRPINRPSMNKVVEMLEANDVESLEMPPKPLLYPHETIVEDQEFNSGQTTSNDSIQSSSYDNDINPDSSVSTKGK